MFLEILLDPSQVLREFQITFDKLKLKKEIKQLCDDFSPKFIFNGLIFKFYRSQQWLIELRMLLPIDYFPYINKLSRLQFHLEKKVQKQWEVIFVS